MRQFLTLLPIALFFLIQTGYAQVSINSDNTTADPSSMLEIKSDSKGMLIPRLTEAQRDAIPTPATSLLIYQSDGTSGFYYYDGTQWTPLGGKEGLFVAANNVVYSTGDAMNDDFVFGSVQLNDTTGIDDDHRFFFDKSKAAFRAGAQAGVDWDEDNLGFYSIGLGQDTKATGESSLAIGEDAEALDDNAFAIGYNASASGKLSLAIGGYAEATAYEAYAFGYSAEATADNAYAIGEDSEATNDEAYAFGYGAAATGVESYAFGAFADASGTKAFAFGRESEAAGTNAYAFGAFSKAIEYDTYALGNYAEAIGEESYAIGSNATATDSESYAIGSNATADEYAAYAIGRYANASGEYAYAIGEDTDASGEGSYAVGTDSESSGLRSMSYGYYAISESFGETALGINNDIAATKDPLTWVATDRLLTLGNGVDRFTRSSALVILKNGDATLAGTLTQNSDRRLKRQITPLQNSLSIVQKLNGVNYYWNDKTPRSTDQLQVGLIAQEVEQVLPELVRDGDNGYKSVNYVGLVPVLVEAIKEQQVQIDALQAENKDMKAALNDLDELKATVAELLQQKDSTFSNNSASKRK